MKKLIAAGLAVSFALSAASAAAQSLACYQRGNEISYDTQTGRKLPRGFFDYRVVRDNDPTDITMAFCRSREQGLALGLFWHKTRNAHRAFDLLEKKRDDASCHYATRRVVQLQVAVRSPDTENQPVFLAHVRDVNTGEEFLAVQAFTWCGDLRQQKGLSLYN